MYRNKYTHCANFYSFCACIKPFLINFNIVTSIWDVDQTNVFKILFQKSCHMSLKDNVVFINIYLNKKKSTFWKLHRIQQIPVNEIIQECQVHAIKCNIINRIFINRNNSTIREKMASAPILKVKCKIQNWILLKRACVQNGKCFIL